MSNGLSLAEKIVITIVLIVIMFVGIVGNILICMIFKNRQRVRQMHISTRYLIINLGFVDMVISINNIIYILNVNGASLTSHYAVCQWIGFSNTGLVLVSIWFIVIISINRAFIVRNRTTLFTKSKTIIYIALVWIFSLAFGIVPILGWSKFFNQESRLVCTVIFLHSLSYSFVYLVAFDFVPGFLIVYHTLVILKLKRRNMRMILAFEATNRNIRMQQDMRQTIMLLVVVLAFIVCFVPNFVIERAFRKFVVPPMILASATALRLLNHAVNPIIYGFLNKDFRRSVLEIAKRIWSE